MDKVLTYTLREADLESTAGGLVNLILKNCIRVTGHEISAAKYTPDGITADGRLVHVKERILPGQTLRVILPEDRTEEGKMIPVDHPLEILYEDEDLLIVNKPAGVVVHPSPGHYLDTMANYVAAYENKKGQSSVCRIVGRLDKETSGALAYARNRATAARLSRQRAQDVMKRIYLAIVEGVFDRREGTITSAMEQMPGVLMKRQISEGENGRSAVTHYRVISENRDYVCPGSMRKGISLVELHIDTGRTHQIRLHMASLGHPLLGDLIYGTMAADPRGITEEHETWIRRLKECPPGQEEEDARREEMRRLLDDDFEQAKLLEGKEDKGQQRAMLHAVSLTVLQPFQEQMIHALAPLPSDFEQVLRGAGLEYSAGNSE